MTHFDSFRRTLAVSAPALGLALVMTLGLGPGSARADDHPPGARKRAATVSVQFGNGHTVGFGRRGRVFYGYRYGRRSGRYGQGHQGYGYRYGPRGYGYRSGHRGYAYRYGQGRRFGNRGRLRNRRFGNRGRLRGRR